MDSQQWSALDVLRHTEMCNLDGAPGEQNGRGLEIQEENPNLLVQVVDIISELLPLVDSLLRWDGPPPQTPSQPPPTTNRPPPPLETTQTCFLKFHR